MKIFLMICIPLFFTKLLLSQEHSKLSILGEIHMNQVIYDQVNPENKPTGYGYGLQLMYKNPSKFEPVIDISFDRLQKYEEYNFQEHNGRDLNKGLAYNLFAGIDFKVIQSLKLEFTFGLGITDSYPCWGFRPAIKYEFGPHERFFGRVALTHTLQKYGNDIEPYGYLNIGAGIRIL